MKLIKKIKDAVITELHGKMTGIIKDQIKLQYSNQELTENAWLSKRNWITKKWNEDKRRSY